MFRSKKSSAAEPTVIGRGAVIDGTVRARGRVQIDGRIEGALEVEGQVSVGPSGSLEGTVIADDLAVGGHVAGSILARGHLHVLAGGSVRGEVRYGSLEVERGGVIHGSTKHGDVAEDAEMLAEAPQLEAGGAAVEPPPLPASPRAKINSVLPPAAC
jgi:cytoskeletal protein CcmA (bactofilin family)